MHNDLAPHLDIALRHAPPGLTITPIPRVDICVGQGSTDKAPCLYRSMICFILQGSKRVAINDNLLSFGADGKPIYDVNGVGQGRQIRLPS
ncbi:hypothetical protein AB7M26_003554 [Pseudomonas sp. F-14 TE3482]|jgi:hypothetical protein